MSRPTSQPTSSSTTAFTVLGLLLAGGLALCGYFVGQAVEKAKGADRFVTVKGLSEREVRADLAIWPIVFAADSNDLSVIQALLDESAETVSSFLRKEGFDPSEFQVSPPRINDFGPQKPGTMGRATRYRAEATVAVRSSQIDRVLSAMERSGDLVKDGVAMINSYEYRTQFLYTALDTIKPEMIAEATKDARRAAEQFAEDSGSTVGAIRNAQQGYFSIQDRDAFSPDHKKVRVVTTVQYFLADE